MTAASPIPARDYPPQSARLYFDLSLYWFALSLIWAGLITIVVQTLVEQMAPDQKDLYLGWTLALGAAVSTVVCIVIGAVSDHSRWRLGRRRPYVIIGTLLSVPPLLALAGVKTIPQLVAVFCLIELWVNYATSPYQAMMPDMVPRERQGVASAYMGMTSLLGQLGGLLLCGALMARPGGLTTIVWVLAVLLVLAMLYTVWALPERRPEPSGEPPRLWATVVDSFRMDIRGHRDFGWLIASRFVINMGFYTATEFLLYYVKDTLRAPDPISQVTLIFIIVTVAGLVGNVPGGMLADRTSKKLLVYVSVAVTGLAALIFLLTSSLAVARLAAAVFGVGWGAFLAVDWAFACNLLPERDEAKYMGFWHFSCTVPQVIAPLIGGLAAYGGNKLVAPGFGYRIALLMVIGYFAVGAVLMRAVRERR